MNIKVVSCFLVLIIVISSSFVSIIANESESTGSVEGQPEDYASSTAEDFIGAYGIHAAYSVGISSAIWNESSGVMMYDINIGSIAASTGGYPTMGDDMGLLTGAAIEVEAIDNIESMAFFTSAASQHEWSIPNSSDMSINKNLISTFIVDILMSLISNMAVSLAWTTVSAIIDAMSSGADDRSDTGSYVWRSWDWSLPVNQCSQHLFLRMDVEPEETVSLEVTYNVYGMLFEMLQPNPIYLEVTAPSKEGMINQSAGVHAIPKSEIMDYVDNGTISLEQAIMAMSFEDDMIYCIESPVKIYIEQKTDLDDEEPISTSSISDRLDYIDHILRYYSNKTDDYSISIVDKYLEIRSTLYEYMAVPVNSNNDIYLRKPPSSIKIADFC